MSFYFGPIRQVGHVVQNADIAMRYWAENLGVGPFYVLRELEFQDFWYRGQRSASPIVTLCFAFSGDVEIELIQQHNSAMSSYREFLSAGRTGMQHLSPWFDNSRMYDAARTKALDRGMTMVQESLSGAARFCYLETGTFEAPLLELSEALLPNVRAIHDLALVASKDWDGSDPVRNLA